MQRRLVAHILTSPPGAFRLSAWLDFDLRGRRHHDQIPIVVGHQVAVGISQEGQAIHMCEHEGSVAQ